MPTTLNLAAYMQLFDEDIAWLMANSPDSLERQHIIRCLEWLKMHKPEDEHR